VESDSQVIAKFNKRLLPHFGASGCSQLQAASQALFQSCQRNQENLLAAKEKPQIK
jgi:hypothetical protein